MWGDFFFLEAVDKVLRDGPADRAGADAGTAHA
jgi:hypothetical protein